MNFTFEEVKVTILDISKRTVRALWFNLFQYNINIKWLNITI